ncbi:hypothetical protein D1115_14105 [Vibrio alfacsensis]|uniref:Uncharacterized protein n=1 Tax=Vibrio alfacsensis TaxID=1074311 RepID=A0ABN5PJ56_9VIBR|nr:hypothetical protein [Vibrio alfacsensis]AXY02109.1 hypothetical protein D1115_14105 [Vibrio alfacsensis]
MKNLAREIGVEEYLVENGRVGSSKALSLLKGYLLANNYSFQLPIDSSVYLNVKTLKKYTLKINFPDLFHLGASFPLSSAITLEE